MVRVRAPTSVTLPSASWRITTRVAPHASRRDVSAETWAPSSRADCPGASGSAGTSVSARTGASTDDDLVPLAGWPRIDPVMEDRLGEQGQRVGLPLAERRRFLGNVVERSRGNVFRLSVQRLAGRVERLHQHGPGLRLRLRLDIRGRAIVARFRIFPRAHIFASLGPNAPR